MKAFPQLDSETYDQFRDKGMDLRDYFAGLAMQAFVNAWVVTKNYPTTDSEVAMLSYKLADVMMEERNK